MHNRLFRPSTESVDFHSHTMNPRTSEHFRLSLTNEGDQRWKHRAEEVEKLVETQGGTLGKLVKREDKMKMYKLVSKYLLKMNANS